MNKKLFFAGVLAIVAISINAKTVVSNVTWTTESWPDNAVASWPTESWPGNTVDSWPSHRH